MTIAPEDTRPALAVPMEILDTKATSAPHRFRLWQDLVHMTCGPLRVRSDRDDVFEGSIVRGQLGAVRVSRVRAAAHSVERTGRMVQQSTCEQLNVCAVLEGEVSVRQDGRSGVVRAGNLVAFDNARPYMLVMPGPFCMLDVMLPHRVVGLTPGETHPLTAAPWSGQHGVSVLLSHLLRVLANHLTEFGPASADRLGHSVVNLATAMFAERLDAAGDRRCARQALLLRIQSFAREYLADPALSPAMLARRHNISLRYLQSLFREQNLSPARWIRDERLARCSEDLRDARLDHLSVAGIAERWGLLGPSHFSRLFRERYDLTPREYRARQRIITGTPGLAIP